MISLSDYLIMEYFVAAFVVGIVIALWHKPDPTLIVKHPTPHNIGQVTYKDNTGNCYRYSSETLKCDSSDPRVKKYVFQD